jgi:hypothetical protein
MSESKPTLSVDGVRSQIPWVFTLFLVEILIDGMVLHSWSYEYSLYTLESYRLVPADGKFDLGAITIVVDDNEDSDTVQTR